MLTIPELFLFSSSDHILSFHYYFLERTARQTVNAHNELIISFKVMGCIGCMEFQLVEIQHFHE
eukprot:snap_masked-scaffold_4-processed-gene-17.25-mRNA-1 protein AED:1.00 eAED:1.00 QI:0/0/0/0/1/1/3/0/63